MGIGVKGAASELSSTVSRIKFAGGFPDVRRRVKAMARRGDGIYIHAKRAR
jgi:hypothetical protein